MPTLYEKLDYFVFLYFLIGIVRVHFWLSFNSSLHTNRVLDNTNCIGMYLRYKFKIDPGLTEQNLINPPTMCACFCTENTNDNTFFFIYNYFFLFHSYFNTFPPTSIVSNASIQITIRYIQHTHYSELFGISHSDQTFHFSWFNTEYRDTCNVHHLRIDQI